MGVRTVSTIYPSEQEEWHYREEGLCLRIKELEEQLDYARAIIARLTELLGCSVDDSNKE